MFAVVPDVRHQLFVRIEKELSVAVDLEHCFVVMAHGRQKRRCPVDAI